MSDKVILVIVCYYKLFLACFDINRSSVPKDWYIECVRGN
jgi:hypothetical protein